MVINIQKETEIKSLSAWDDVLNLDDQLSAEEKILQSLQILCHFYQI